MGSGMVPFERPLVSFYKPSIVFASIRTRFRDIAAFVLQHATFSLPTTSSLPKISPCSAGSRWIVFWLQRAKVRAQLFHQHGLFQSLVSLS